jgi:regulator of ribonuclease activity A
MTSTSTADLCDADPTATPLRLPLRAFGGAALIDGPVVTARVDGSNQLLKEILAGPGGGRVLLVDGGGAGAEFALVGDSMAQVAIDNGWQGVVVDGLVRDAATLAAMPLGVWARGTCPQRGPATGTGETGRPVSLGAVVVRPGDRLVADADGMVVVPA